MIRAQVEASLRKTLETGEFPDVVAVYLFGSVERGAEHAESDVDIAVLLDRAQHPSAQNRFERRLQLMADFAHTVKNRDLDLLVLNDLPPLFSRRIVLDGALIHCRDAEATRAFSRDAQLLAADIEPFLDRMRRIKLQGLRDA